MSQEWVQRDFIQKKGDTVSHMQLSEVLCVLEVPESQHSQSCKGDCLVQGRIS